MNFSAPELNTVVAFESRYGWTQSNERCSLQELPCNAPFRVLDWQYLELALYHF